MLTTRHDSIGSSRVVPTLVDSTHRKSSRKRKRILCLPVVNSWMLEGRKC